MTDPISRYTARHSTSMPSASPVIPQSTGRNRSSLYLSETKALEGESSRLSESLRYHLLHQERLEIHSRQTLSEGAIYRLLLPQTGHFQVEHRLGSQLLVPGMALLLLPDEFASIEALKDSDYSDADCICLRFDFTAADLAEPEPLRCLGVLPGFDRGRTQLSGVSLELVEELHTLRFARNQAVRSRLQSLFGQLMALLTGLEQMAVRPHEAGAIVAHHIAELETRLAEDWTVTRLAEQVNLSQRQYTAAFRSITGMAPLEYIAALRIERAELLLRQGAGPLREIASQTGFRDEYYFNRRFRAATGSSPGRYARQKDGVAVRDSLHRRVIVPAQPKRVLYLGEAIGDLLALGIRPVGGCAAASRQGLCGEESLTFTELASDRDFAGGQSMQPDLIICTRMDEAYCRDWSNVAPVLAHHSWSALEERMLMLGHWFGCQQESEQWLERYFEAERSMWHRLGEGVRGQTASVFIFERGRMFVMGRVGLSALLYHPNGFQPVPPLLEILRRGEGYVEISPEHAADYAADRIFMLMSQGASDRRMSEVFLHSAVWHQLAQSAQHGVHIVEAAHWNFIDAYSRSRLLDTLPDLLQKS
ncbi:hypothetical protein B9G55_06980 [Saccharibacillus sp. O16]|nr:hypothetical protein B9G55_06980 [Saccharibacillus sp. O16]